jgi:asparagine synthase (glutamine-hydrolysing)
MPTLTPRAASASVTSQPSPVPIVSAIAGIIRMDDRDASAELAGAMIDVLAHRGDERGVWCDGPAALASRGQHAGAGLRHETQVVRHREAGWFLVGDARIDNREDLARTLGLGNAHLLSDGAVILGAYERWGEACPVHLVGDFSFAIWNAGSRTLFCARDAMGVRPFYYAHSPRRLAFASEIKALRVLDDVSDALDPEQVAMFLEAEQDDRDRTLFREIRRLPAAHCMTVSARGVSLREYWTLDTSREIRFATDGEYAEALREQFTTAVRCRLRGSHAVGATLSGGLDSSSIVCTARNLVRESGSSLLQTFSLVFPGLPDNELRLIDERRYIDAVVAQGGVTPHFVRGDQLSPLADLERVLWHMDEPFFAPNLYLHWGLYGAAQQQGVRVLLDGFDGDATVSHGLARLDALGRRGKWDEFEGEVRAFAKHRAISPESVLPHYGLPLLDELARTGRWLAWARAAHQVTRRFELSRGSVSLDHGLRALVPERARHAWRKIRGIGDARVLRPELDRRLRERRRAAAASARTHGVTSPRQAHAEGLRQPLYQTTLELADKAAAAFGIEARYPFFDRRLMELCVGFPAEQKLGDGWSRLVFRRAMNGLLPSEIQWRAGKGNLSPNFHRNFRELDGPVVGGIALDALEPFADVAVLKSMQRRGATTTSTADPGGAFLLFRASILAAWLEGGRANARPAAEPVARAVSIVA